MAELSIWDFLPFELCDFAIFVAVCALVTRSPLAAELTYFWALSGTALAMITPDAAGGFPDWRWTAYFVMHGAVVVSAVVLVMGLNRRPRPGAPWRVFGWTAAYAAAIAVVDLVTGANFLYLRRKPVEPTMLDWFGPWPWYIAVEALIGIVMFQVLMLPFRRAPDDAG